jgi:hypothetical protein
VQNRFMPYDELKWTAWGSCECSEPDFLLI